MKGKDLCETLKTIRKKIAEANGIPYEMHECTHEGDCPGTCPLCDMELQYLQDQIRMLEDEGKEVKLDVLTADEKELLFANIHFNGDDEEGDETCLMGDPVPPEYILAGIPVLPEEEEDLMKRMERELSKAKKKK